MPKKLFFLLSILISTIFYNNLFAENTTRFVVDAKRNLGDFYVITSSDSIPGLKYISYSSYDDINSDLVRFNLTTIYKVNSSIYNHFSQRTIMWNKMELDLTKDFLLDLELQFSDTNEIGTRCWSNNNDTCKGGMGIAFVMIPEADTNDLKTYIGSAGPFLGAIPKLGDTTMPDEFMVLEFDTYCNEMLNNSLGICDEPDTGKPKVDHIALVNTQSVCHYPSNSNYVKIDTNHNDVKASSDIYCVRIKWFKSNNKYKLNVYVKNKMTQDDFNLRYTRTFDSLGQVMPTLSPSNSTVNWGIAGGSETEMYSSTQRVIFKNLIVDNDNFHNTGVYINKHFANSLSLYLVNLDNTKQFLYPTFDDCCGYNLRHFENSNTVCIQDINEIRIGHANEIEYLGLKINWYDINDSLLESNNNVFNLQDYKKIITNKDFILRAEIEKAFNNQGYPDTIREDLYFHIHLKNNYFTINDHNCINEGDSVYSIHVDPTSINAERISLPDNCDYEITNIDSTKFRIIPHIFNRQIWFNLKDTLDNCETEFVLRRLCSGCTDSVRIKVYNYENIGLNDIRILKSCSYPKIQIRDFPCSDILEYGLRFENNSYIPIIDNQLPIDTNNYNEGPMFEIYNKYTNTKIDFLFLDLIIQYDDLLPFYQESPKAEKLDRSGEQEDICNYVVSCKLLSTLDTSKYEITSEIYGNRTTLYTNSNLEIQDTIQVQCIDGAPIEYILNIACKADSIFPAIDVCTDTLILMCSCNGCDYCDAFDDKMHINIARDSAGVLIDLGNQNGFKARGRYCKFRINIDDFLECDNSGSRILLQNSTNGHGEWLTDSLDSLVYLITGLGLDFTHIYEYVQDTIRISYITPQGDTCYKEKPVYCECYAGVDLEIRPNAYPELPTVCSYTVKEMETGGITFLLKDIQGSVVQILGQLDANSSPVGDIPINTTLLPSGVYFVTAEKNGIVVSYNPVQFIKQ